ncbi:MAG: two-component regulator propeller domain-containing protein [Saprospiraceae bacterium]|nr:two-component regulator propeller domain-containing protein [Saprospiraceae bacterium]
MPAQAPLFENLGAAEGLSQGMIFDMLQDQKGFIWLATKDGLNRYDGYSFRVFQNDPFDPFSLSDNEVQTLLEDKLGRIWAGTAANGVSVFVPQSGKFYQIGRLSSQNINCLAQTSDGAIWAGSGKGVNRILLPDRLPENISDLQTIARIDTFLWENESNTPPQPRNRIISMLGSRDGKLWVSTHQQTSCFDPASGKFQVIARHEKQTNINYPTSQLREQDNGTIWVGLPGYLFRIRDQIVEKLDLPEKSAFPLTDLAFDAMGNAYIGTRKQVYFLPNASFAPAARPAFQLLHRFPENGIIGSTKILFDRGGLLWVGTNGYGLLKHNPGNPQFLHYWEGKSTRGIIEDKQGRIWVWQAGGVFRQLTGRADKSSPYLFTDPNIHLHDLAPSRDGQTIWVCGEYRQGEHGECVLIGLNAMLEEKSRHTPGITVGPYSRVYEDPTGRIWLTGGTSTLARFDPASGQTDIFDYSHVTGFRENAFCIYMDAENRCWIGTPHGLIEARENGRTLQYQLYRSHSAQPNGLNSNYIQALLDDPKQPERYIWIGTRGGGLNRLDKQTGACRHFTTAEGLPNNVVYGILPDHAGNLWLSTNRGLSRFTPDDNSFQNFFSVDGLQDNEFNTLSYTRLADGRLLFGGVNGITVFDPARITDSYASPPVFITRIKINGQAAPDSLIAAPAPAPIELRYDQNQLTFDFAALDFSAPRMNQYRYRLIGVGNDWVESTTTNSATYAHLAPGRYVFEVMTGGSHGVWGMPIRLEIRILPPWWRTFWAYVLYFAGFIAGVLALYRFQVNKIRLENHLKFEQHEAARLLELDRLKSQFFSSVTHEFRTPLTLLLEPARQLLAEAKDQAVHYRLELIERNARRLLDFVNQLLDLSKLEAGQMPLDLRPGNPDQLVKTVVERFQALAEQRGIGLVYEPPASVPTIMMDEGKWDQILSNLLSNALKFTDKNGTVWMQLVFEPANSCCIKVEDTGIGIAGKDLPHIFNRFFQTEHSRGGSGIGLSLTKELVERMGGTITVDSPLSDGRAGACFTVTFPVVLTDAPPGAAPVGIAAPSEIPPLTKAAGDRQKPDEEQPLLLLIEDDADLRRLLRSSLPPAYRIAEASDGAEGIAMAFELIPDLVISDLMMPNKDGFEVAEALRNNLGTSHIPMILLTAKSSTETKLQGLQRGADVYLTKPFRADELVAHIENLLQSRRRIQAYFAQLTREKTMAESTATFSTQEQDFLQRLIKVIEDNLDNEAMDADAFARSVFISRSQLHRKISALTGIPLTEFVRNYRLDRAREMLMQRQGSISEIAWRTGFPNSKYFSTCFKERFGSTPSGFLASLK